LFASARALQKLKKLKNKKIHICTEVICCAASCV